MRRTLFPLLKKKLFDAIGKCKSPIKSINRVTDLDTQLSKEINLFTSGGGRGEDFYKLLYVAILDLFYQQVLIARSVFQRHGMSPTKFVQMTC